MKQLKRLILEESQTSLFTSEDEPENSHFKVDAAGNISSVDCSYSSCPCKDNDYLVDQVGYGETFPKGTISRITRGTGLNNKSAAMQAFQYLASKTKVEWGMTLDKVNGKDRMWVYTDNNKNVTLHITDNTKQLIHSHLSSDDLSQEDREIAREYYNITHTLYYKGEYKNFGYGGFY